VTDDRQDRIRRRAHEIWEQAGRPEGAHQEHWEKATADIDSPAAKPKKAAKKADAKPKAEKPKAAKAATAKSGKAKSK
jgi:hypothetical protein